MRRVLIFIPLFLLIASCAFGTTYFIDATSGDDENNGLSPISAWKTISRVNNSSFNQGDDIRFKCGEIWNEKLLPSSSGSSGNPIIFSNYGTGNIPIIEGTDVAIWMSNKDYLTFENLQFQGGDNIYTGQVHLAGGCDYTIFKQCIFVKESAYSLYNNNGTNLIVDSCDFHGTNNNWFSHIWLMNYDTWTIKNSIFNYGALCATGNNLANGSFCKNEITIPEFSGSIKGIWIYDQGSGCGNNFIISDNTFVMNDDSDTIGMEVHGDVTGVVVENNIINAGGSGDIGIQIGGVTDGIVRYNKIFETQNHGILYTGNGGTISHNILIDCGIDGWGPENQRGGIILYSGDYGHVNDTCENVEIYSNIVISCNNGIIFLAESGYNVPNNNIYLNSILETVFNDYFSIGQ